MKKIFVILFSAILTMGAMAQSTLTFNANAGVKSKMTVYDGTEVSYTAYERLFYVTNVEDSTYQFLNVYVPDPVDSQHRVRIIQIDKLQDSCRARLLFRQSK